MSLSMTVASSALWKNGLKIARKGVERLGGRVAFRLGRKLLSESRNEMAHPLARSLEVLSRRHRVGSMSTDEEPLKLQKVGEMTMPSAKGVALNLDESVSRPLDGVACRFNPEDVEKGKVGEFSAEHIKCLKSIEGLKEDTWLFSNITNRKDALNTLEKTLAAIQGRPPLTLVFEEMKGKCGFFDGDKLHINIEHVKSPQFRLEVIDTVAHEGRHGYQYYAVRHPGFHPNDAEVKYWAANELAYFKPKNIGEKFGPEYYYNQPVELNAWGYGMNVQNIYKSPFASFNVQLSTAIANASAIQSDIGISDRILSYIDRQLSSPRVRQKIFKGVARVTLKLVARCWDLRKLRTTV